MSDCYLAVSPHSTHNGVKSLATKIAEGDTQVSRFCRKCQTAVVHVQDTINFFWGSEALAYQLRVWITPGLGVLRVVETDVSN